MQMLEPHLLGSNSDVTISSYIRESKIPKVPGPWFSDLVLRVGIKWDNVCETISAWHTTDPSNVIVIIIIITKLYGTGYHKFIKIRHEDTSKPWTWACTGVPKLTCTVEAFLKVACPWAAVSAQKISIVTLFPQVPRNKNRHTHRKWFLFLTTIILTSFVY